MSNKSSLSNTPLHPPIITFQSLKPCDNFTGKGQDDIDAIKIIDSGIETRHGLVYNRSSWII